MARYVKRKKKKVIKWKSILSLYFVMACIVSLYANTIVRNDRMQDTKKLQQLQNETTLISKQNELLEKDIARLQDRDRIVSIANAAGLNTYNNITTITSGD